MVTGAVAELSMQTHEQGGTPVRGGVHWRYGMGFVLLLASILSLVLVGQIAGWIQDPHRSDQAGAAADARAAQLEAALRALPVPSAGVPEADYAAEVRAQMGVLLDVAYPGGAGRAPDAMTVRLPGSATSGVLSGRHVTTVLRCYRYSWTQDTSSTQHRSVACPTVTATAVVAPAIRAGGTDLRALAVRLTALPAALLNVPADDDGARQLLAAAELPTGTAWRAVYPARDLVLAVGRGGQAGCLFVDLRAGLLTAWVAPLLEPCTAERASLALPL